MGFNSAFRGLISRSTWFLKFVGTVGNLAVRVLPVPNVCLWYLCHVDSCIKVCRIILKTNFTKLFSQCDLQFLTPLAPCILCCIAECLKLCIVSGELWDEGGKQQMDYYKGYQPGLEPNASQMWVICLTTASSWLIIDPMLTVVLLTNLHIAKNRQKYSATVT
jgi:hypothetical protein